MKVNDRAIENIKHNHNVLKSFDYIDDINFFNGNTENGFNVLNNMGIRLDTWHPYDGRLTDPLPGEYGVWVSTINLWKYIVDNSIETLLVLEDDIILQENFLENLNLCLNDLPKNFDFLSLYYFQGQNEESEMVNIGSEFIQKSNNQYSAAQAMIYSYVGAKKLLKLINRKGMEYTNDCFIYRQSLEGLVNGYSIKGQNDLFLTHSHKQIESIIDPTNFRNTEDV